jgi:HAD superfamily hydrolase (TIGR01509 family)
VGLRFLLFDLDGTLITPGTDFKRMREQVRELLIAEGVPADFPIRHILGGTEDACAWLRTQGRSEAECDAIRARAYAFIEERERAGLANAREIPGVREALDEWRTRYQLGIFTRTHPEVMRESIAKFDLGRFDVLLSRADAPPKPDPGHVKLALALAKCQPSEALAIGDHVFDVQSARGAGVRAIGVLTGSGKAEDLLREGAERVVPSVASLRGEL